MCKVPRTIVCCKELEIYDPIKFSRGSEKFGTDVFSRPGKFVKLFSFFKFINLCFFGPAFTAALGIVRINWPD